jgi:hypothetical protein
MVWGRNKLIVSKNSKAGKKKQPAIKKEEVRRDCAWRDEQLVRQKGKH